MPMQLHVLLFSVKYQKGKRNKILTIVNAVIRGLTLVLWKTIQETDYVYYIYFLKIFHTYVWKKLLDSFEKFDVDISVLRATDMID